MPFDAQPGSWITNWSEDGTTVSFNLADLSQALTTAEADAVTGDWRDCFYSLLEHTYQYFNGLAAVDKPTQVTISRVTQRNSDTVLKLTYTVDVYAAVLTTDVNAE